MNIFVKDIEKILDKFKEGILDKEQAVREACLAFDKEMDNPSGDSVETRMEQFKERMKPFAGQYPADMLAKFFDYWTGFKTPKSRQMHFEKQKTFKMGLRLKTWHENQIKFSRTIAMQRREVRLNGRG